MQESYLTLPVSRYSGTSLLQPRKAYHRVPSDQSQPDDGIHREDGYTSNQFIPMDDLGTTSTVYDPSLPLSGKPIANKPSGLFPRLHTVTGWRVGAAVAVATASLALVVNVIVAIWAGATGIPISGHWLLELASGDCKKMSSMNVWTHLAINALSTALLSGSNYCMQCLVAPTREDINRAHAEGKWLDVGVQSIRNLGNVGIGKAVCWWLLGLSSIPLHLMFNSAFFTSIATNDYNVAIVTPGFVTGAPFNEANGYNSGAWQPPGWTPAAMQTDIQEYERLDNKACIEAYAVDLVTDRRGLVVVSHNASTHNDGSVLNSANFEYQTPSRDHELALGYDPYPWICSDLTNQRLNYTPPLINTDNYEGPENCYLYVSVIIDNAEQWSPGNYVAEYCLSEKIQGHCAFNVNLVIIVIVIICNVGKLIGMSIVAFSPHLGRPLMTVGDAISSFLDVPDESTKRMCLASRKDLVSTTLSRPRSAVAVQWQPEGQRTWIDTTQRWYSSATKRRWWTCILLFAGAIGVILGLLILAVNSLPDKSAESLWSLGFGQLHSQAMIVGWALDKISSEGTAVIANVLIANLPQAILSFLYLVLNGLCTSMFLANEWSQFASQRKTLRVSQPQGDQRKSYFLQLPYRIAVPLIVMSGLLHWLVSQSIFIAVIAQYDEEGNLKNRAAVTTCGFSPVAMIVTMVAGGVIISGLVLVSLRRLDGGIPLVGSCSAAISAACHRASWEDDAISTKGLQWGAVSDTGLANDVGHCCFSSGSVSKPEPGKAYE